MNYSIKYSIFLSVIFILSIIGFSTLYIPGVLKLKKISQNINSLENEITTLESSNPQLSKISSIEQQLIVLREKKLRNSKVLLIDENSKITYKYLDDLRKKYTPKVSFDFQFENKNDKKIGKKSSIYTVSGNAPIASFYRFLDNIENQRPLYLINRISVDEYADLSEDGEFKDFVAFTFTLEGIKDAKGTPLEKIELRKTIANLSSYNPFKARIYAPIDDIEQAELLDLDSATILSMTEEEVILSDDSGEYFTLAVPDKIAYGFLQKINFQKQFVKFSVNRIGIPENKIIYLNIDSKE